MKNLIVIALVALPIVGLGQTKITAIEMSDGTIIPQEVKTQEVEDTLSFVGNDQLSFEQNIEIYLAKGDTITLQSPSPAIEYDGLDRIVISEVITGAMNSLGIVEVWSNPGKTSSPAWELGILFLCNFFIFVFLQKATVKDKDPSDLILVSAFTALFAFVFCGSIPSALALGSSSSVTLVLVGVTFFVSIFAFFSSGGARFLRNFFLIPNMILQAISSLLVFKGTEEVFYAVVLGTALGLCSIFFWRRKKKEPVELTLEERGIEADIR